MPLRTFWKPYSTEPTSQASCIHSSMVGENTGLPALPVRRSSSERWSVARSVEGSRL
jgi:hypothetical protein